jgi:hypothetical protein
MAKEANAKAEAAKANQRHHVTEAGAEAGLVAGTGVCEMACADAAAGAGDAFVSITPAIVKSRVWFDVGSLYGARRRC